MVKQSTSCAWSDALEQIKRASGPEIRFPRRCSVQPPKRLQTTADILMAARWRLRKWPSCDVDAGIDAVAALTVLGPLEADRPEVMAILDQIEDGRDPWGALCALLVMHANAVGELGLLWAAGIEVQGAYRQAQRAAGGKHLDALDRLVVTYFAEGITGPADIWQDLARRAEDDTHSVLAGFDAGVLAFQAKPANAETTKIEFPAFRFRVQRLRRKLQQLPANAAPHLQHS